MSRLARNIIYNVAGQSVTLVLSFVAVRFVYRDLGDDEVGLIFFAITTSTALVAALDFGVSSTVVREVAGRGHRDSGYVRDLLRTASLLYWVSYLLLACVVLLAADALASRWLNIRTMDPASAATSLQILSTGLLLALPRSLYASLLKGLQRMGTSNAIDVTSSALQQAGIVVIVGLGGSIIAVSSWIAASSAAWLVLYVLLVQKVAPRGGLVPGWNRETVRANRRYTSSMGFVSILAMIHSYSDRIIVSRLLPLGAFGLYAFGYSALTRGMIVTSAVAQAALPSLSNLHHSGDREALLAQYKRLQDFMCYATIVVFAAVPFLAPLVFSWLFGPAEADLMLLPATILAVGFYMNSTLNMPYVLSLAVGKPGIALSLNAFALVLILPATLALVWKAGLIGAAVSWFLYHVFAYGYAVPRICRECADGRPVEWYLNVAKFAIPAAIIYGAGWGAAVGLTHGSSTGFVMFYLIATALYALAGWRALLPDAQRRLGAILLGQATGQPRVL